MSNRHEQRAVPWIMLGMLVAWGFLTYLLVTVWGDWVDVFIVAIQFYAVYVIANGVLWLFQRKDILEERRVKE